MVESDRDAERRKRREAATMSVLGLHLVDVRDMDSRGRIRIVRRDDNPNGAKAKGHDREIPVLHNREAIQETFQAYLLEEYPPEAETKGHGMLLVNLDKKYAGKPMTSARLNNLFYQLRDRTGIEAHPHLFRHTFATRMLQAGYLDQYVQQLLGHKSIATTKDICTHCCCCSMIRRISLLAGSLCHRSTLF